MFRIKRLSLSTLSANWQLCLLVVFGILMLCGALFMAERSVHIHLASYAAPPAVLHLPEPAVDYSGEAEKIQRLFQPADGQLSDPVKREDELMSSDDERLFNAPASDLPVRIAGIISSSLPQRSLLIVQSNSKQYSLSPGDRLPESGADLVRIFPDRAIIHYHGKYASLTMAN